MDKQQRHSALKYEIVKEQAAALGVAGTNLKKALEAYRNCPQSEQLLGEVVGRVYGLLLQREVTGFTHENIGWLQAAFHLPDVVWERLGVSVPKSR